MFTGELKPFQKEGFEMALEEESLLIAMYMGLGKTVLSIAILEHLIETGMAEHGLIVVPASLKYQWRRAIEQFTDHATVVVIDGSPKKRAEQYERYRRVGDYCIMNYEQVVNDWDIVKGLPLDFMVCDEVQAIKNFKPKRSKHIKKLKPRYRIGLSGQPLENQAEEVFSIFEWVDKEHFGSFRTFDRAFLARDNWGKVVRVKQPEKFHEHLSEKMFRKSQHDPDVEPYLPRAVPRDHTTRFDLAGRRLWKVIATELLDDLENMVGGSFDLAAHYGKADGDDNNAAKGAVMAKVTCLKMLGDHPDLLIESAKNALDPESKSGSVYAAELMERGLLDKAIKPKKYKETKSLLDDLLATHDKVVLFSTFKGVLHRYHKDLPYGTLLYTGDMSAQSKDDAKERFSSDPDIRVLLCSDSGGTGLDVPAASALVNYNLPWSAGLAAQRNARIRRLSSEFTQVYIHNMLVEDSIDIRQHEMLQKKNELSDAITDGVLTKEASDEDAVLMDTGTLKDFLIATLKDEY